MVQGAEGFATYDFATPTHLTNVLERETLAASREPLPMPPWEIGEKVTLYRMKGRKAGDSPIEYNAEVVEIGGPRRTISGKYRGKRFREIRVMFIVTFTHMTHRNYAWLKWFEGETQARDATTYSWIEANEPEETPIIFD